MKKLTIFLILFSLLIATPSSVHAQDGEPNNPEMLKGTVPVPFTFSDMLLDFIKANPPEVPGSNYAITNLDMLDPKRIYVSIVALENVVPDGPWDIESNGVGYYLIEVDKSDQGTLLKYIRPEEKPDNGTGGGGMGANVALPGSGVTATASSNQANYPPSKAIDGGDGSVWVSDDSTNPVAGNWIYVDLQAPMAIQGYRFVTYSACDLYPIYCATTYKVSTSNNASSWVDIYTYTVTGPTDRIQVINFGQSYTARYFRFYAVTGGSGHWEVNTIELYPPTNPGDPTVTTQGGSGLIFPWRPGTQMQFGSRGVHDAGFGLSGWKAVDFWSNGTGSSAPNAVYAAETGDIGYLCRDAQQVSFRVGNLMYTHMRDTGQASGMHYDQGQYMGEMVTGDIATDICGWAQNAGGYHLHFGFPNYNGYLNMENCVLDIAGNAWTCGGERVVVGGKLTANWQGGGSINNPGTNFWTYILNGIQLILNLILAHIPTHASLLILKKLYDWAVFAMDIVYLIVKTNFEMSLVIAILIVILVLEFLRWAIAQGMWIYKLIKGIAAALAAAA